MKNLFFLILLNFLLFSCAEKKTPAVTPNTIKQFGEIEVLNGKNESVTIKYSTDALEIPSFADTFGKTPRIISYKYFQKIINTTIIRAKNICSYPLTFEPKEIWVGVDSTTTVTTILKFHGLNAFNVPFEEKVYVFFDREEVEKILTGSGEQLYPVY